MKKIFFLLILISNLAYGQINYIPPQAFKFKDIIKKELDKNFPELYEYNYIPSLAEQESCISLKHSKCWNSLSSLKSVHEEGAGLFQITRAYNADGSIRFDSLENMKKQYKEELKDAKWETIYQKPDIQIKMAILMLRDIYKKLYNIPNKEARLHMTNASYNGGLGGLLKERRACGLKSNCDPNLWFNNVEKVCLKSKKILYGTRNACDINREHTKTIFHVRLPKYKKYYFINDVK